MQTLSIRQKKIIQYLLSSTGFTTIRELANNQKASERSIRYDLDYIDYFLTSLDLSLERVTNKGISLTLNDKQLETMREALFQKTVENLSTEDYILFLKCQLLILNHITINSIITNFDKSYYHVEKLIKHIQEDFSTYKLNIITKKGKGVKLIGHESNIRLAFQELLKSINSFQEYEKLIFEPYFSNYYGLVDKCIDFIETALPYQYLNKELLRQQMAFVLLREKDFGIDITLVDKEILDTQEYSYLKVFGETQDLSESEIISLAQALLSTQIAPKQLSGLEESHQYKVLQSGSFAHEISQYIFSEIRRVLGDDFIIQPNIVKNLFLHLKVAVFRAQNNIKIENSYINTIRIELPLIYELTKDILYHTEQRFQIKFDKAEEAYIAMHLAAIYNNISMEALKPRVAFYSDQSLASSIYLSSKFQQAFPNIDFIKCYSEKEVEKLLSDDSIDLLITTTKLIHADPPFYVQNLVINPSLSNADYLKIQEAMLNLTYSKNCKNFLINYKNSGETNRAYLRSFVELNEIQVLNSVDNWEMAIYQAAKPLIESKKLEKTYVEKIISIINEYGTYMVIIPGIAFVHAGTDDGINCTCSSVLVLKNPIKFGNQGDTKIYTIVVCGIKGNEKLLLDLIYIFEKKINLAALQSANITPDLIYSMHS